MSDSPCAIEVDDSDVDVCVVDDEVPIHSGLGDNKTDDTCHNVKEEEEEEEEEFDDETGGLKYQQPDQGSNNLKNSIFTENKQFFSQSKTNPDIDFEETKSCEDASAIGSDSNDANEYASCSNDGQLKWEQTNENCNTDEFCLNLSDSPEEDDEEPNEECDNRFYFESDHLAFKHNKDYKMLLKTLVILEAQRIQAVKDLHDLYKWKDKALKDPIPFIESLQSKDPPKFPKRQAVANLPHIEWTNYVTPTGLTKIPPGYLASTRRSFRGKNEAQSFEPSMKSGLFSQEDNESVSSEGSQDQTALKFIRGRTADDSNSASFNRLWTSEEQERLEKLLNVYPPEDVEARRWEKIAKALGNRTPKQVSSRVQKYFIKLARAGLPIPGRAPHMNSHKKSKINPVSYRNSTFFPSWKPSVYMNDDEDETSSVTTTYSDDTPYVSDEEMIAADLKETAEYKELKTLKKFKKQMQESGVLPVHNGFVCDGCGLEPIQGTRWHCSDCSGDVSFDVCSSCMEKNRTGFLKNHPTWHRMVSIRDNSLHLDGDYLAFELQDGKYNYLDPNFIPKTR